MILLWSPFHRQLIGEKFFFSPPTLYNIWGSTNAPLIPPPLPNPPYLVLPGDRSWIFPLKETTE